ncbi:hypothetical protein SABIM44S_02731 [Streptomyces abikoensis]
MAVANFSAALPAPSHPMANPGYGKHNAPDQAPPGAHDFVHLPKREASIAAFIDRLPEGAAMDVKTLAKVLPDYGQQACRTAIQRLREAGHVFLRPIAARTRAGVRWVTLTFFSRTARSQAWWEEHLADRAESASEPRHTPEPDAEPDLDSAPEPTAAPEPVRTEPEPEPEPVRPVRTDPRPRPSRAYQALARLRHTDPRLTLSAAECEALEPLAAQWLAHDTTPEQLTAAVTAGLSPHIHSPAGFVRNRLEKKMPPVPLRLLAAYNDRSEPREPITRSIEACVGCGEVDLSTALGEGLCKKCADHPDVPDTFLNAAAFEHEPSMCEAVPPEEFTRWIDICRVAARNARRSRT